MAGDELGTRAGELRRLTIMFCDVVGSTELSGRWEPETYRELIRGYRTACRDVIETRFEGHIVQLQGDGILAIFGFPVAHENDAERGVRAALALVRAVRRSDPAGRLHGGGIARRSRRRSQRSAVRRLRRGRRLRPRRERRRPAAGDRRSGHGRRIGRGSPARSRPTSRSRRASHSSSKALQSRCSHFASLGERRVPVDSGRGRHRWSSVTPSWSDCGMSGRRWQPARPIVREECSSAAMRASASPAWWPPSSRRRRAEGGCVVELHGSPFHVDAGFHPVRSLIEARCGITDETHPAERLERLEREVSDVGLERTKALPLLAAVLGIDPSAGYEPGRGGGPRARGADRGGGARLHRLPAHGVSRRSSSPRTCTGSTTRAVSCWRC